MQIEKLNDNQIRCTLTREDLEARHIKLSELAYGSEKANALFREMVQQAARECGFEVNDIPLMVEAIPAKTGNLVLVITKVEYPDELDSRFSHFSEPGEEYLEDMDPLEDAMSRQSASDILSLFREMSGDDQKKKDDQKSEAEDSCAQEAEPAKKQPVKLKADADIVSVFEFDHMVMIERLACVLNGYYHGQNDLYKFEKGKGGYYLLMHKNDHTPEQFNKICNIASEYGHQKAYIPAMGAYFEEHSQLVRSTDALQMLAAVLA